MNPEPESLILQLLSDIRGEIGHIRADVGDMRADAKGIQGRMATKEELRSEIKSLRADIASDLLVARRELCEQIDSLRFMVVEFRASMVGRAF